MPGQIPALLMELTLGDVANTLGTITAAPKRVAHGYSIDSRTLAEGDLFFAIRGPRFDGHEFIAQVLERGASAAVVTQGYYGSCPDSQRPSLIPVADTVRALQQLGQSVRKRWGRPLVAVTGSAGKSTTKEMTAAILVRRLKVLKSKGNLNNHLGVPLTLLELQPEHDAAVAELAMSGAGEIGLLTRLAAPNIGVVTNVAAVHLEFFDSVDSIALAKKELVDHLPSGSTAVLNFDDPRVSGFAAGFDGQVLTFGFGGNADFRAVDVRADASRGCRFRLQSARLEGEIHVPLPGRHNVQNALAAIAAASLLGATAEDARDAMEIFQPLALRSEILTLAKGIVLINDSYNSNPLAMERMLETLARWPGARRRIVVAGEMLELGSESPPMHLALGRKCPENRVDWLIAVQGDAKFLVDGALQAGVPAGRARFFATPEEAGEFCGAMLEPGDVVLVKGSRGVHLERVVDFLRATRSEPKGAPFNPSRG